MKFRDFHPNIKIRIITSFLTRFVSTMIFPFMAIYFSIKMGQAIAGILLMINVLSTIIVSFYSGYVADAIGRKKIMVISQIITVLAFLAMALANSPFYESAWLTFYMMLIHSLSSGLMGPASQAMLIDVSTKENRKYMYSINFWAVNFSYGLGIIFGGMLFKTHRFELFLTLTAVGVLTLVLISFFMSESFTPKEKMSINNRHLLTNIFKTYQVVLKDRLFLIFSFASLLVVALEFQTINYIAVRLEQEFIPQMLSILSLISIEMDGLKMLSWIRVENTFVIVIFTTLAAAVTKKFKDTHVLYFGVALYTVGYVFQAFSNHMMLLFFVVFIATIGELIYVPVRQSYLAELINDDKRSSYMAMDGLVFQGAKLVGASGVIIGAIAPSWVMAIMFFIMGTVGLLLFAYVIEKINRKQSEHLKDSA
jgi:MFS transporter, DHA1 family, multidrug resistance protein B